MNTMKFLLTHRGKLLTGAPDTHFPFHLSARDDSKNEERKYPEIVMRIEVQIFHNPE